MLCVRDRSTYALAFQLVACFLLGTIPTCLWKSVLGDLVTLQTRKGRHLLRSEHLIAKWGGKVTPCVAVRCYPRKLMAGLKIKANCSPLGSAMTAVRILLLIKCRPFVLPPACSSM